LHESGLTFSDGGGGGGGGGGGDMTCITRGGRRRSTTYTIYTSTPNYTQRHTVVRNASHHTE